MYFILGGDGESVITGSEARLIVANQRQVAVEAIAASDPALQHIVGRTAHELQQFVVALFDERMDALEEKSETPRDVEALYGAAELHPAAGDVLQDFGIVIDYHPDGDGFSDDFEGDEKQSDFKLDLNLDLDLPGVGSEKRVGHVVEFECGEEDDDMFEYSPFSPCSPGGFRSPFGGCDEFGFDLGDSTYGSVLPSAITTRTHSRVASRDRHTTAHSTVSTVMSPTKSSTLSHTTAKHTDATRHSDAVFLREHELTTSKTHELYQILATHGSREVSRDDFTDIDSGDDDDCHAVAERKARAEAKIQATRPQPLEDCMEDDLKKKKKTTAASVLLPKEGSGTKLLRVEYELGEEESLHVFEDLNEELCVDGSVVSVYESKEEDIVTPLPSTMPLTYLAKKQSSPKRRPLAMCSPVLTSAMRISTRASQLIGSTIVLSTPTTTKKKPVDLGTVEGYVLETAAFPSHGLAAIESGATDKLRGYRSATVTRRGSKKMRHRLQVSGPTKKRRMSTMSRARIGFYQPKLRTRCFTTMKQPLLLADAKVGAKSGLTTADGKLSTKGINILASALRMPGFS